MYDVNEIGLFIIVIIIPRAPRRAPANDPPTLRDAHCRGR